MAIDEKASGSIRAQLCGMLDRIENDLPRLSSGDLVARIYALRAQARPYGMAPLDQLARGCEDAVTRLGPGAMVRAYLGSMREAVGCDSANAGAGDAYLATVAVRMG